MSFCKIKENFKFWKIQHTNEIDGSEIFCFFFFFIVKVDKKNILRLENTIFASTVYLYTIIYKIPKIYTVKNPISFFPFFYIYTKN